MKTVKGIRFLTKQEAQKYLLDNGLDDLILNKTKYRLNTPENAKNWKYVSDVVVEFSNQLQEETK